MIWCGNGEVYVKKMDEHYVNFFHVMFIQHLNNPIVGIKCSCKPAIPEFTILRHGGWRGGGRSSCVTECVPCQISGQIRRSIRICDNPW
ncbi:hypothetical protein WUBG_08125 [Wuchereria bancrofti]|nr:hypothetical protein WUBG_08125 [Wuchereria bancrofti]